MPATQTIPLHRVILDRIAWQPQPGPQTILLAARDIDEILFGGARGGGKTDAMLGDFATHANEYRQHARGILFRRSATELTDVIERSKEIFTKLGAIYLPYKSRWTFPGGGRLWFRHISKDKDAEAYQGHAYTWFGFEELTNYPTSVPIDKLKGSLRSAHGVRCRWLANANPGGPGHNWVKSRFITAMRPFCIWEDASTGTTRMFIPSKLSDNKILMQQDPRYVDRLRETGPEWLVQAWLSGNWDIVAGGMFDDVWDSSKHIIPAFAIPQHWPIYRSFDWGSTKPFSLGYTARTPEHYEINGRVYLRGTRFRVNEWYGCTMKPNEGLKMIASDVAKEGLAREAGWAEQTDPHDTSKQWKVAVKAGPAGTDIFTEENGHCIANDMSDEGMWFHRAHTAPRSRKTGWEAYRKLLKAGLKYPYEEPGLFVFDRNLHYIRTVPVLPRDQKDPDDLDSKAEDHIADESRYEATWDPPLFTQDRISGF